MGLKQYDNLFTRLPYPIPDEVITTLVRNDSLIIERIVSLGQATPEGKWLQQDTHEWVVLIQGAAKLLFEGEKKVRYMQPGDWCEIPSQCRHRVEWTDPSQNTIWLAVHYK